MNSLPTRTTASTARCPSPTGCCAVSTPAGPTPKNGMTATTCRSLPPCCGRQQDCVAAVAGQDPEAHHQQAVAGPVRVERPDSGQRMGARYRRQAASAVANRVRALHGRVAGDQPTLYSGQFDNGLADGVRILAGADRHQTDVAWWRPHAAHRRTPVAAVQDEFWRPDASAPADSGLEIGEWR